MIQVPRCFIRRCTHYQGVRWIANKESSERCYCTAFPAGIPVDIALGKDLHQSVRGDQINSIVFEKKK